MDQAGRPRPTPVPPGDSSRSRPAAGVRPAWVVAALLVAAACEAAVPDGTPPVSPGSPDQPREVILIARDYGYAPGIVDLVPGETIVLRVVNGGLEIHEAILGDLAAQLAWEDAERATVGHPPGPTPVVSVPPGISGLRVVVASGERVDVRWTVPVAAVRAPGGWFVGCHIPGHWEKGMVVPIRFIEPGGRPITSVPSLPVATPGA